MEEIIAVADSERERVELLAADGAHSTLHARAVAVTAGNADELIHDAPAEVTRTTADYEQSAIILSMRTERDIGDRAFERFTPEGPLAVLPGVDGQCAVVWVRTAQSIQSLGSAMDTRESEQLRAALQDDFGYRLGRILSVEKKAVYPLRMTHSTTQACRRIAILGAGAHTVHPVAAQGFNLGLRDVATLAHSLGCLRYEKESRQLTHILAQWSQARAADSSSVVRATDILARGFLRHWKILAPLRKASFLSLSLCPPWRRMLLRRYLQLGQPLNEPPLPVPDLPASK